MNPFEMPDSTDSPGSRGDFERYGLVAALTLVVLCLLLADRVRSAPHAAASPSADRALRVRIGNPSASQARTAAATARGAPLPSVAPAPVPAAPLRSPEPPVAARNCVVGEGETLGQIALRELGTSRRAREIADLNGITDLHLVRAGQTLHLPPR